MFLGGRFGHQQEDQQHHRLFVRCIKSDRRGQLKHRRHGRLQPFDTAMRNGHTMAQAGGAQALTRKQAVGHQRSAQPMQAFKQKACFFKSTLLACSVKTDKHLGRRQDGRETVHSGESGLCTRLLVNPRAARTLACPALVEGGNTWTGTASSAVFAGRVLVLRTLHRGHYLPTLQKNKSRQNMAAG